MSAAIGFAVIFVFCSCGKSSDSVMFWPGNAVRHKNTDYRLRDLDKQLEALSKANPEEDARYFFRKGDVRFISIQPVFTHVNGVPNDSQSVKRVYDSVNSNGFKLIAFPDDFQDNTNFLALRDKYAEKFNGTLFKLTAK